jgi:hypothetical protein
MNESKESNLPKAEKRELSAGELDSVDHLGDFAAEFGSESDRAAVILAAAKLDILLYQLLQRVLKPSTASQDALLDGEGPLATFHARIEIAHRLGLLDDRFVRTLHLVRKIRNSFAHEHSSARLDTGGHRDRVTEMAMPFLGNKSFPNLTARFQEMGKSRAGAEFRTVVALLCTSFYVWIPDTPSSGAAGGQSRHPVPSSAP